jgi:hypothetical protein
MNRIMPVSPTDMSEAARNAIGQNVWPAAAFFKSGVSAPCVAFRFEDVPPAMKYVQCGHSTHRRLEVGVFYFRSNRDARHPIQTRAETKAIPLIRLVGILGLDFRFIWSV